MVESLGGGGDELVEEAEEYDLVSRVLTVLAISANNCSDFLDI